MDKSLVAEATTKRVIGLTILLMVAWLLWSGIYKPILLALGLFSCLLCVYLVYRTGFFRGPSGLHLLHRLPGYWLWLLKEVFRSSIDVARIVLNPKLPISPTMIELEAQPTGPIGQAILGNAITLSPGTVTVDLYQGKLMVHCLTQSGADDLATGVANRKTAALTSK